MAKMIEKISLRRTLILGVEKTLLQQENLTLPHQGTNHQFGIHPTLKYSMMAAYTSPRLNSIL
jgi:hypothetical protein